MARAKWALLSGLLLALTGCGGAAEDVEVVDLNKVLDAVAAVLDEGAEKPAEAPAEAPAGEVAAEVPIAPVDPAQENEAKQQEFLTKLAAKLNEMKMIKSTIGVKLNTEGAIEGFTDPNANMTQEDGEERLFLVEIDAERNRLIASDTYENHRDHHYRYRPSGLFMGYMLGSMLGRQNSHYAASGIRPDFNNRTMSPQNYHSNAVSSAKASAASRMRSSGGSARSTGGSRGFSFGK